MFWDVLAHGSLIWVDLLTVGDIVGVDELAGEDLVLDCPNWSPCTLGQVLIGAIRAQIVPPAQYLCLSQVKIWSLIAT